MRVENPTSILTEEIDEEVLARMPEWFRKLRKEYWKCDHSTTTKTIQKEFEEGSKFI